MVGVILHLSRRSGNLDLTALGWMERDLTFVRKENWEKRSAIRSRRQEAWRWERRETA